MKSAEDVIVSPGSVDLKRDQPLFRIERILVTRRCLRCDSRGGLQTPSEYVTISRNLRRHHMQDMTYRPSLSRRESI